MLAEDGLEALLHAYCKTKAERARMPRSFRSRSKRPLGLGAFGMVKTKWRWGTGARIFSQSCSEKRAEPLA
jgi:hypothetical protein